MHMHQTTLSLLCVVVFSVVFTLFLFYGISVLPFVYLVAFAFDVAATGYIVVVVVNFVTGAHASLK